MIAALCSSTLRMVGGNPSVKEAYLICFRYILYDVDDIVDGVVVAWRGVRSDEWEREDQGRVVVSVSRTRSD